MQSQFFRAQTSTTAQPPQGTYGSSSATCVPSCVRASLRCLQCPWPRSLLCCPTLPRARQWRRLLQEPSLCLPGTSAKHTTKNEVSCQNMTWPGQGSDHSCRGSLQFFFLPTHSCQVLAE